MISRRAARDIKSYGDKWKSPWALIQSMTPPASAPDLPQRFWEVEAAKSSAVIKALSRISWTSVPWALVGLTGLTPEPQFIFFLQLVEFIPDSLQHLRWPLKILSAAWMGVGKGRNYHAARENNPKQFLSYFQSAEEYILPAKKQNKTVFKNVLSVNGTTLNFGFPKFFSNSRGGMQEKYVKFTCLL